MNKKPLSLLMVLFSISLIAMLPVVQATEPTTIPNIDTFYVSSIGMPQTVDPAWSYDTASGELIFNVYDTLIWFEWEKTDTFVPLIAEDWYEGTPDTGYAKKLVFDIEEGITFQNGAPLTAYDVEYSFERWMVMDRSGGPTWMIFEPLLGCYHADPSWANDTTNPIAKAVETDGNLVWFNLVGDYSNTIFYQVVAQGWASILNEAWATAQGCWDGDWSHWLDYHNPETSPLDITPVMMGSGPWMLDYIDYTAEKWSIVMYPGYFQGWPAPGASDFVTRCTYLKQSLWATRKTHFLSNDPAAQVDMTAVPRENVGELEPAVASGEVRYIKDLSTLTLSPAIFYNFHIPNSTYAPNDSPYDGNEQFSEYGIPWDFFCDANVRYGFASAFDYDKFISEVYLGEASRPATPLIQEVGFDDLYTEENAGLQWKYDSTAAQTYLQAAWPGRVGLEGETGLWDTGFTMTITYNTGNTARETACTMLKTELESYNTKFHITVQEVDWPTYLDDLVNYPVYKATMPIFLIGWLADYPDPHNFFFPFYHTYGDFTFFQSWYEVAPDVDPANGTPDCDEKIEAALVASPRSARKEAYRELMYMWHDDLPTSPLIQGLGRHYERTWVQGWYYNPIYPGWFFYPLWKGLDGDVNGDCKVGILDAGLIQTHWDPGPPKGPLGYNRKADISPTLTPDGKVNIADAAVVNAHWGDTCGP
jgi:peptide/nickel transport system substrate-binding protein